PHATTNTRSRPCSRNWCVGPAVRTGRRWDCVRRSDSGSLSSRRPGPGPETAERSHPETEQRQMTRAGRGTNPLPALVIWADCVSPSPTASARALAVIGLVMTAVATFTATLAHGALLQ